LQVERVCTTLGQPTTWKILVKEGERGSFLELIDLSELLGEYPLLKYSLVRDVKYDKVDKLLKVEAPDGKDYTRESYLIEVIPSKTTLPYRFLVAETRYGSVLLAVEQFFAAIDRERLALALNGFINDIVNRRSVRKLVMYHPA